MSPGKGCIIPTVLLLALVVLATCQSAPPPQPPLKLSGTLRHHSQQVKSVKAWHGTEFTVAGQAVLPSAKVSRAALMQHVGQTVEVTGRMEAGERWKPDPDDVTSHPVSGLGFGGEETIHRGGGIRLTTLRRMTP